MRGGTLCVLQKVSVHVLFEVCVPGVDRVDVRVGGQLPVHQLQLVQLGRQVQVLHEYGDSLSLVSRLD